MIEIREIKAEEVWPIRHQVMYPDLTLEDIKLEADAIGLHLGLFYEGNLTSVVSLFEEGQALQFRKFATLVAWQGKGFGSALLRYIINYAKREGFSRIWCNARRNASSFYRHLGFEETKETFYKDGYDFVIMELLLL